MIGIFLNQIIEHLRLKPNFIKQSKCFLFLDTCDEVSFTEKSTLQSSGSLNDSKLDELVFPDDSFDEDCAGLC